MKLVPCYICNKTMTAKSNRALAKLCDEHNTKENRDKLKRAIGKDLIKRYNGFMSDVISKGVGSDFKGATENVMIPSLRNAKPDKKKKERKMGNKKVNEYGEPV